MRGRLECSVVHDMCAASWVSSSYGSDFGMFMIAWLSGYLGGVSYRWNENGVFAYLPPGPRLP